MIKALRQRDFVLLWLGGLISLAGGRRAGSGLRAAQRRRQHAH
jgi:hypothetical protein